MPKNKKGGSRHKKMARKHKNPVMTNKKLRLAKEEGEMYAKVLQVYGGGRGEVLCSDGKRRLLCIARRFKGRNRWDNNVTRDAVLLVGKRDFEVLSGNKKEKVDLLYVYSDSEMNELKNKVNVSVSLFPDADTKGDEEEPFEFTHDTDDWNTIKEEEGEEVESKKESSLMAELNDDDFNFDDI